MKICMVVEDYLPIIAGGPLFVYNISKLISKTNKVSIITSNYAHAKSCEKTDNIIIFRTGGNRLTFSLGALSRASGLDCDLYHAHGVIPGGIAKTASGGKPVILHIHGYRNREVAGWFKYNLQNFIIKLGYAKIICSDSLAALAIKKLGVDSSKIEVVGSGVDLDKFRPSGKKDKKTLLFVGRLVDVKGLDALFEAVKILKEQGKTDFEVKLVGKGSMETRLKKFAEDNGLENIEFIGEKSNDELPYIYEKAGFFVLPSRSEGHPLVLLEAMACGLPVIVSDIENLREISEKSNGGFTFNSGDPESLAKVIIQALDLSEKEYLTLAKNARRYVEDNFSWEKAANAINSIYDNILK